MSTKKLVIWLAALGRRASSLRFRVVMLAVVAITPLAVDRIRLVEADRTERIASASAEALALARTGAEKQAEALVAARSVLQTVSHTIERVALQGDECNRMLADVAADVPWTKSLAVINRQGRFVCASRPSALGTDVSDRSYFQSAIGSGGFVVSDFIYPRTGASPGTVVAFGKRGPGGEIDSVIVALIDLQWIGQLGALIDKKPGATALLIDTSGIVLIAHPSADAWRGRDVGKTGLLAAIAGAGEGTVVAEGFDGVPRVWGFAPLSGSHARLLIGLDRNEILGRVTRETHFAYGQLAFAILLVFLGAWFFGERAILRPIRALARMAEKIGRGDLGVRVERSNWAPEFLPLKRSLDSMAARLAQREHGLRSESERLRELASLDSLTGLANRRAFDTDLAAGWIQAQARREPVALVMVDVDHFKLYNDCYGHLAGDACLRAVGALLSAACPKPAIAARWGGEEFALLIPGASAAEARLLAEHVRRAIEALRIEHSEAPRGVVTVSIGLASMTPTRGATVDTLVVAADAALYTSKETRNAVTIYSPPALAKAS